MPFMHPVLFWGGAAAAATPIIIHLLNRRRFRILDWAAMRFLLESIRRNRRRIRIEELILLALRCLAVLLLALAVGRLLGCAGTPVTNVLGHQAQRTHVFIFDDSVSMGQKIGDSSSFRKAAADLADMLRRIPNSDRVAVLLTSRPEAAEAMFPLNSLSDPESLIGRLKTLTPSDTTARLHLALAAAGEILEPVTTEKRLYVLSDFRRADYASGSVEEIRREFKALDGQGVRLRLQSYGAPPGDNLTVESIDLLDKMAISTVASRMQLRVRNNGSRRAENVVIEVRSPQADGAEPKISAATIRSVEPGEAEIVQFGYAFPDAGAGAMKVHLPADSLTGDNIAHLAVNVREARKVLIVDGEPDLADPSRAESYSMVVAMDPNGDHGYGNAVDVVSVDRVADANFGRYDAVILANVARLPQLPEAGEAVLDRLARYVRDGGGLAIFTGARVDPTFYNGPFYARGLGLCPLQVKPPVGDPRDRREYVRLMRDSIANAPVMRTFQGALGQFTQMLRFYAFTPTEPLLAIASGDVGPAKVLGRFDNTGGRDEHSPAVAMRSYGAGSVVMVCTAADIEWSDWPKDMTFVSFVNDLLESISRQGLQGYTDLVGKRIEYELPQEMTAARAALDLFGAEEDVITLEPGADEPTRRVSYEKVDRSGAYRLTLTLADEARTVFFARNVDPAEGRLDVLGREELAGLLQVEFAYVNRLDPATSEAAGAGEGSEYWKLALAAMLVVLALEVFLGQRFGHYK